MNKFKNFYYYYHGGPDLCFTGRLFLGHEGAQGDAWLKVITAYNEYNSNIKRLLDINLLELECFILENIQFKDMEYML